MKPAFRLCVGLILCVFASLAVTNGQEPQQRQLGYVAGEVLVRFRPDVAPARRDAIVGATRGSILRRLAELNVYHVRVATGSSVASAIAAFRLQGDVLSAEPNFIRQVSVTTNDPYWVDGSLWGLRKIQADAAWGVTTGSASVVVADIDTGVNYNHPDLAANMWRNPGEIAGNGIDDDANGYIDDVFGIDTANHDSNPMDDHGHGTHTAGTIGAIGNNATGVVGVNWNVKILPCKFLKANGSGSDAGAIECFNYIVALKKKGVNIRVSNNSWGGARDTSLPFPDTLKNAIDAASNVGILNIFAAGNAGSNNDVSPFDPASFDSPGIVSVAASDSADQPASFSNTGATSVDIAAPGVSIVSTSIAGYAVMSGTSMATPHVAGGAALLAAKNPALNTTAIKDLLLDHVDQLPQWSGRVVSQGRLNVFRSVVAGAGEQPPTVSISQPADGTTFTAPATISVEATAADPDGSIAQVEFFANGNPIGISTTAPYRTNWSNVPVGHYSVHAIASDNHGLTQASVPVSIDVVPAVTPIVTADAITPSSGSGMTSTFIMRYGDTSGAGDLSWAMVLLTSRALPSSTGSCWLAYSRPNNMLALSNDAATSWSFGSLASGQVLQNGQCSVILNSSVTAVGIGNALTLTVPVTFKNIFPGIKSAFLYAESVTGANSGWQLRGAWTVPGTVVTADSITPNSGAGTDQTFSLRYTDTAGAPDLSSAIVAFTSSAAPSASNSCWLAYFPAGNSVGMLNDAGTQWMTGAMGSGTVLQNSQCSIALDGTTAATLNGNILTWNIRMHFKSPLAGTNAIFMNASSSSGPSSNLQARGTWVVP